MNGQTASRPCGVTVCASSAITSPLISCTGAPVAATAATRSACRDLAAPVTKSSVIAAGLAVPSASLTACGPRPGTAWTAPAAPAWPATSRS